MSAPAEAARRSRRSPALIAIGAGALLVATFSAAPGTTGAYLESAGHAGLTITTAEACASGTAWATQVASMPAPLVWWRFAEPAGAASVAGEHGSAGGTVTGTGPATLGLGAAGLPECDTTGALALAGAPAGEAFVRGPAGTAPSTLTAAVFVRADPGAGGGLLSFGDGGDGPSTTVAYRLSLDADGRVVFDVATDDAPVRLRSSVVERVDDGRTHLVAVTVDGSGPGRTAAVYVDGVVVDTATVPGPAPALAGELRTGGGDQADAVADIDEVLVWSGTALDGRAIADLWAANHW